MHEKRQIINHIKHNNKDIIYIDVSDVSVDEGLAAIEEVRNMMTGAGEGAFLFLTNIAGAHFDLKVAESIKDIFSLAKVCVRKSAVVGANEIQVRTFNALTKLIGIEVVFFADIEAAKNWLTEE